jgi:hypothetical protein
MTPSSTGRAVSPLPPVLLVPQRGEHPPSLRPWEAAVPQRRRPPEPFEAFYRFPCPDAFHAAPQVRCDGPLRQDRPGIGQGGDGRGHRGGVHASGKIGRSARVAPTEGEFEFSSRRRCCTGQLVKSGRGPLVLNARRAPRRRDGAERRRTPWRPPGCAAWHFGACGRGSLALRPSRRCSRSAPWRRCAGCVLNAREGGRCRG